MVALFVVGIFVLFILIDYFVVKARKEKHPAFIPYAKETGFAMFNKKSFLIPGGIMLAPNHTWLKKMVDGKIKLGIDDFVKHALGKVNINLLKSIGDYVIKGEEIFEIFVNDKKVSVKSPVEGTVLNHNLNLQRKNIDDVYGEDWITVIKPKEDLSKISFFNSKNAVSWLKDEFSRLKDFVLVQTQTPDYAAVTMHDGGNIVEGVVGYLEEKSVKDFEKEFLSI
ncbi:MAG: hypothetical protein PVH88_14875 [Ignavibacteria bacterium]|jgi:glycine cleavage system H lipoate-binding protein